MPTINAFPFEVIIYAPRFLLYRIFAYDPHLRYVCGFEPFGTAPSKSCFNRFYSKLAQSSCLETLFTSLVKQAEEMDLLDSSSVAIDATKVDAYEKSVPRKNINQDGNAADWGIKSKQV